MPKITLENRTTVVNANNCRIHLEAGEQEVTTEIEKALQEAGLIKVKKPIKQTEK